MDAQISLLNSTGTKERNFQKWQILGVAVPFNGFVGKTYDDEINYMKDWIDKRLVWMDSQISSF